MDTPHTHPAQLHAAIKQSRSTGQRAADVVAAAVGSWTFVITQNLFLTAWVALNALALINHWDPYPFLVLNLILSWQAFNAAPIIMMSQNRATQIDRAHAENAYHQITEIDQIQQEQLTLLQLQHAQLELLQSIKALSIAADIALNQVLHGQRVPGAQLPPPEDGRTKP